MARSTAFTAEVANNMTSAPPDDPRPLRRELLRERHPGRYGVLLGAIFTAFALQGIATPAAWEQVVVALLLAFTFLLALWIADVKPWLFRGAAVILLVLLIFSVVEAVAGSIDNAATRIVNALLVGLAPPAIGVGVVRSLRARQAVTVEAVLGVLSIYILLGMFFAAVYGAIDHLGHGSFFVQTTQGTVSECLYFSFTTLTTVGYGDLTASSNLGHTLSVCEALLGQIYLVTVVSVIVANLGRRRQARA
jgi:Ion channel